MNRLGAIVFVATFSLFFVTGVYWCYAMFFPYGWTFPQIECATETIDLGSVDGENSFPCEFIVTNTGNAPLEIVEIRPGCGSCLAIRDYPKSPIPSGEKGVISVSLLTEGLSGSVKKSFLVRSNDPRRPFLLLTIQAEVIK